MLDGALPPTADPFSSTTFAKVAIDQFGQAPIFTVRSQNLACDSFVCVGHSAKPKEIPCATSSTRLSFALCLSLSLSAPQALIFVYFALVEGKGLAFAKKQISDDLFQVRKGAWFTSAFRCLFF